MSLLVRDYPGPHERDSMVRRLFDTPVPLAELEASLCRLDERFHDTLVPSRELKVADDGRLLVGGEAHRLQPRALDQLAARLKVPASYLRRCPTDLQAHNLNRWLGQLHSTVLVRFDSQSVRALLSDRYQPVSNLEMVRSMLRAVPEDTPVRYELTGSLFVAQVLTPGYRQRGIHGGMNIVNSETGHAVVRLSALLFRTICLNGLIMGDQEVSLRRRHTHDAQKTLEELTGMAELAWGRVAGFPGRLEGTRTIRIAEPEPVFDKIAERYGLGPPQRRAIGEAFQVEPGLSLFEVINAVTRAANFERLPLEERTELQEVGGRILQLAEGGYRWL